MLRNFLPMAKTARKLRVAALLNLGAFLRIFLTKEFRASPDYFKTEADFRAAPDGVWYERIGNGSSLELKGGGWERQRTDGGFATTPPFRNPARPLARSLNRSTGHFLDARSNSGLDPESMMHVPCMFFFPLPETVLNFLLKVQKKVAKKRTFFTFLRHFCCAKPACQLRVAALLNLGAWLPPMLQESGFGRCPNK